MSVTDTPLGGSPFPPIADYAFLSDCETSALVSPGGAVEWMCLPRMDSPSVFGALLDRGAGSFRLAPADQSVPAGRRYIPGTMVCETTWGTRTGWLIVRDLLLIGPWHHEHDRSHSHRRSPTDYDADHVLLRMLRCVNGSVEMNLECEPVLDYGRSPVRWEYTGEGYERATASAEGCDLELTLTTDLRIGFEGPQARARTTMRDGDVGFVALSWTEHGGPTSYEEAYAAQVRTADYWHEWLSHGDFPDHPWRQYLQRSALTLKGLTYAPTGAMLAASTTSLPEDPGGERNWDYRYTWVRDSTFMLWGLYTLGFEWGGQRLLLLHHRRRRRRRRPAGDVRHRRGARARRVRARPPLGLRRRGAPVRIGNDAYSQQQHDVWGALLDSIYLHTKTRDQLPEHVWPILVRQVETAIDHWQEPDRSIWEVRGEPQHFTSSKVFCWVACDRGARLARLRGDEERAERWQETADEMHADVCSNAVDERGVFVQHYGSSALDASTLLIPLLRFLPADDERVVNTVNAIASELTEDGLVLRYRTEETDDGMAGSEGTFAICSFWLVSALEEIGDSRRARQLCEKMLGYASPLLLYAEEIDARSGRHLGNFPQAFTHLALINAVMHVIRADEQLASHTQALDASRREGNELADARIDATDSDPGPRAQRRVAAGQAGQPALLLTRVPGCSVSRVKESALFGAFRVWRARRLRAHDAAASVQLKSAARAHASRRLARSTCPGTTARRSVQ